MTDVTWLLIILATYIGDPSREVITMEGKYDTEIICEDTMKEAMIVLYMNGFVSMGKCERITTPTI
jgi:hypothetical protein